MFISLTKPERDTFLSRTNDCLIPGYTGHCPTLKFKVGKRYGANTQEIIREMSEKGMMKSHLAKQYREIDPLKGLLDNGDFRPIERVKGQLPENKISSKGRTRPYILGYTGYIPGLMYRYGKTYGALADDSLKEFYIQKNLSECERSFSKSYRNRVRSAPKIMEACKPHQLQNALLDYDKKHKDYVPHISEECPPVTGYTGHIPRMRSNEASLSRNYHSAAKNGLHLLKMEQENQRSLMSVQDIVKPPEEYLTKTAS